MPVAIAVTIGLMADRYFGVTIEWGLAVACGGVVGWACLNRVRPMLAIVLLWAAFAGLGAAYHHAHRHSFDADDIGEFATPEPSLVRVRGVLTEDPITRLAPKTDALEPIRRPDRDAVELRVTGLGARDGGWVPASGLARLTVEREAGAKGQPPLVGLRAGDAVELVGMLTRPNGPSNPGERDYADYLLDQRTRAEIRVSDTTAGVVRTGTGDGSAAGWLSVLRRRATTALTDALPHHEATVAIALLLGDGSAMEREEWDAYVRTGVVHALAISGQHLAVLAGFIWVILRAAGVRRDRGAWVVLVVIVGYTILTGLRPSGVRSAAMVAAVCGGIVLRRPAGPANAFALGWLVVVALNPTDPFSLGSRLSFLSVFVLIWGVGRWLQPAPLSPLEQLIDASRPLWVKAVRAVGRAIFAAYAITVVLSAVNAPLLIADQNVVSPVGIVIGPVVVILTTVALLAGFLLMLFSSLGWVAVPFAVATQYSLAACTWVVQFADDLPAGANYVPGVSMWWLVGFYAGVAAVVLLGPAWRFRTVCALAAWVLVGVAAPSFRSGPTDELRVTFLAVGKGGCLVIETPDGRCLIYDVGTTSGPGVVRRVVAPYLWFRGVRRVDELFISHADTDHFNGVGELARRFPIGQVTLTPSFVDKPTAEVAAALEVFRKHHLVTRLAAVGDRFTAPGVEIETLHPPPVGPVGSENERSLVLLIRHEGHSILLTGDLEKAGASGLLAQTPRQADVLMAPHHGSRAALPRRLLDWSRPHLVVVSRGIPQGNTVKPTEGGPDRPIWDTHTSGAIILRSHPSGLVAEPFRGESMVVRRGR